VDDKLKEIENIEVPVEHYDSSTGENKSPSANVRGWIHSVLS
jgi:hypothetical protein